MTLSAVTLVILTLVVMVLVTRVLWLILRRKPVAGVALNRVLGLRDVGLPQDHLVVRPPITGFALSDVVFTVVFDVIRLVVPVEQKGADDRPCSGGYERDR